MTTYKAADSKREEFRKYLEKAGVVDGLTKVLVNLYEEPEKPNNAMDFLLRNLGGDGPESVDVENLKADVIELQAKVGQLTAENEELKAKLEKYEPAATEEWKKKLNRDDKFKPKIAWDQIEGRGSCYELFFLCFLFFIHIFTFMFDENKLFMLCFQLLT